MALTPERKHTMRVFAEAALRLGETVPVGPKKLLELLDAAGRSSFAAIRERAVLDELPRDSVLVAYGPTGLVEVYHKQYSRLHGDHWYTAGVSRPILAAEVPLPALLVFIPKR